MTPQLTDAKYTKDYKIWLRFADGTEGEIDLKDELNGDIFEPLKDLSRFRAFNIHPELKTLTWPNGADLAPELLHKKICPDQGLETTKPQG